MADFLFEKYDMEAEKILCNLNEAQRDAVTATEGFVRVIAGAGSGKTRAVRLRISASGNYDEFLSGESAPDSVERLSHDRGLAFVCAQHRDHAVGEHFHSSRHPENVKRKTFDYDVRRAHFFLDARNVVAFYDAFAFGASPA